MLKKEFSSSVRSGVFCEYSPSQCYGAASQTMPLLTELNMCWGSVFYKYFSPNGLGFDDVPPHQDASGLFADFGQAGRFACRWTTRICRSYGAWNTTEIAILRNWKTASFDVKRSTRARGRGPSFAKTTEGRRFGNWQVRRRRATFTTTRAGRPHTTSGFRNPRYSRFGNLRYAMQPAPRLCLLQFPR